eukprot:gnl/TRDRNA2_/TRDRNA2_34482_c0_seq1.p1 gnl/TRDRNA2_/TRDRNA2_34482_c0~~gnl/TRDRNA2_/TRDRNA2_34482_c0_seq1.p1  ORF type:complete len:324 (+),score=49.79 gnl/TRDRNA2_/TRDRNA2_34482_c0_seq1:34-1005(+)
MPAGCHDELCMEASYEQVFPAPVTPIMGTFTHSGFEMATYTWKVPDGKEPKGLVVLVHGFGEHLGRWGHVASYFAVRGYEVVGIDHVCHGQSDGMENEYGYLESFDVLVENWYAFMEQVVKPRNRSTAVYAHSTGGLAAFLALTKRRDYSDLDSDSDSISGFDQLGLRCVIYSAPLLRSPHRALYLCPSILKCCLCCGPSLVIPGVTADELISYQPAVEATEADPLYWGWKINFTFVRAMLAGSVEALDLLTEVDYPFLVLHNPDDKLCAPSASKELYAQASTEKNLKGIRMEEFKGCAHELHNEEDWQKPLQFALDFMRPLM